MNLALRLSGTVEGHAELGQGGRRQHHDEADEQLDERLQLFRPPIEGALCPISTNRTMQGGRLD
ncbi:hypothetical protein ABN401_11340 [Brevundimonas sp. C11]|uniref:Uncharacterized protein n=1 Tax=Brevundimonas aurifodinae TaxID=1508312 RepID=A0ABV1NQC0_9CAUL